MTLKKPDPTFLKHFQIRTKIHYIYDVQVEPQVEEKFRRAWNRFFKKYHVKETNRSKRFDAFFERLRKGKTQTNSDRVAIKYIDKTIGYGVFAKKDIAPYSILNHYSGILRLDKSINPDNDSTFTFSDFPKYAIDGLDSGGWTRFMNHGKEGAPETNVTPWEHYIPEGPRIVFTASHRGIKKGEQLLYSYGDMYWEEDEFHGW